ncbi:hypothetical protein, partial [Ureibacillus massiliensis]|uniref:hypothetical protein n=1 Tax=Ureibacillus massiliensis TaxID=292806 RepID=UPI0005678E8F
RKTIFVSKYLRGLKRNVSIWTQNRAIWTQNVSIQTQNRAITRSRNEHKSVDGDMDTKQSDKK